MSTTIYHNHHIIPQYMGGTDDPSNLIKLTIEEHAQAHRDLYEKHGDCRDKLAYQGLEGLIGKDDILFALCGNRKGSTWYHNPNNPKDQRMFLPEDTIPLNWVIGRGKSKVPDRNPINAIAKAKASKSLKSAWKKAKANPNSPLMNRPKPTKEAIEKVAAANRGKRRTITKTKCPSCKHMIAINVIKLHIDSVNCLTNQTGLSRFKLEKLGIV